MEQHWLGKTKPKQAFQIDLKCFQKVATEFKKKSFDRIFYWLTD